MMTAILHRLISLAFDVPVAHAQITGVINAVGANNYGCTYGETLCFSNIAGWITAAIDGIVLFVGLFLVTRAGIALIVSQQDDKLDRAKRTILSTLVGIMLIFISQSFVNAFFNHNYSGTGLDTSTQPQIISVQIVGIMNWALTLVMGIGALMIVFTAIKIVANFGKDQGIAEIRRTVFAVAAGIMLIIIRPIIQLTLGVAGQDTPGPLTNAPDATKIVAQITTIVANLLLYLALVAVAVIVYAGVMMILTLGNEDQFTKSRTLIIRAAIGLGIILISYVFAAFILQLV